MECFDVDVICVTTGRVGMRRSGETEGVRQSLGNVTLRATKSDIAALKRRVVVKPLDPEVMW